MQRTIDVNIIQNLGTALITMAAGTIVDEYGYDWLEVRPNFPNST